MDTTHKESIPVASLEKLTDKEIVEDLATGNIAIEHHGELGELVTDEMIEQLDTKHRKLLLKQMGMEDEETKQVRSYLENLHIAETSPYSDWDNFESFRTFLVRYAEQSGSTFIGKDNFNFVFENGLGERYSHRFYMNNGESELRTIKEGDMAERVRQLTGGHLEENKVTEHYNFYEVDFQGVKPFKETLKQQEFTNRKKKLI